MKKILLVFACVLLVATSCNKQASNQLASEKMTGAEFTARYGIELPFLDYSHDAGVARNNKPKANAVTLVVWTGDLILTESESVLTTTLSANAEWGGVQKFFTVDATNNGVSVCNWNWSYTTAPATQTCNYTGAGSYRSWTSDKVTYDIHVSSFLVLP